MRQEVKLTLCLLSSVAACFALAALSSSLDSVIANMSPPEEFPEETRSAFVITGAVLIGLAAVAVLAAILWLMLKRFCWGIIKEQGGHCDQRSYVCTIPTPPDTEVKLQVLDLRQQQRQQQQQYEDSSWKSSDPSNFEFESRSFEETASANGGRSRNRPRRYRPGYAERAVDV